MSARDLALLSLDRLDLPDWPARSLASSRRSDETDPRDIELGARIESATLKNLLKINHLIAHFANRSITKIDPRIRKIIGIALAQILFLDRIPVSAAVDEAVKQGRRFGRTSAAGFVNAVLRRATREPIPAVSKDDPREYARLELSHPPELFDRLVALVGTSDALRICEHNQRRPPTILRLSPGVTPQMLTADEITLTPHERCGMVVVQPTPHDLLGKWATDGRAQAQDPTAASVADFCDIHPGMKVLDRCAGLGTKSIQLRERVGETGTVVAIDPDPRRIRGLRQIVKARRFTNVYVVQGGEVSSVWEGEAPAEPGLTSQHRLGGSLALPKRFDRVLIDVPCSNSGVLARRSAARYFQSDDALQSLQKLQREIVIDTLPVVAPGGLLIYSTCSIWKQENELFIQRLLDAQPEFMLVTQQTTLPSFQSNDPRRYHDGGYVAALKRL